MDKETLWKAFTSKCEFSFQEYEEATKPLHQQHVKRVRALWIWYLEQLEKLQATKDIG